MSLTSAQLAALKADIAVNTNTVLINGVSTQIKNVANNDNNNDTIAEWYNGLASSSFYGNYSSVPVNAILGAITWKNFTPADAVPTDTALNVAIWNARNAMCQTLQMNLQNMTIGRQTVDATRGKTVSGFQDSLSAVPSGVGGASKDAGWSAVQKILCRVGTYAEKLFADTTNGNGSSNTTAATFTFEGRISGGDVTEARNS